MASTLRGGIIGCGFFAQFHIEAWRRIPDVQLVAACDLDPTRARLAAPNAYTSPEEMLDRERLDFVDIVTRPESHLELVQMAVSRQLPAICQKPMAPAWEQAVLMADVADRAGVLLMIHENWRWQPWYRAARDLIGQGQIGRPVTYRFRTCKGDGHGENPYTDQPYFRTMPRLLIYETIVHHLDTARFLFGEVDQVFAEIRRNNPIIAGEDQAQLLLRHRSDLLGVIHGHRFLDTDVPGPVMGEAWFEGDRQMLRLTATGDLKIRNETVWKNTHINGYRGDSVLNTQRHFIECLRSGAEPESSAREYLKTVALVEAAYRAAQEGCSVRPPI